MSKVRIAFSVSIDGFGAGLDQDIDNPVGVRGFELFNWFEKTDVFRKMHNLGDGSHGIDNDFALRGFDNVGAWIMGRNMFSPLRGPWKDESWKGWWGDNPPYHVPVFVLTHHTRPSITMEGGTAFHFVTEGPERALEIAREAANGRDIRIGGGAATIRQYLQADVVDEMQLALSPLVMGEGEHLFSGINLRERGFTNIEATAGEHATHFIIRKSSPKK